MSNYLAIATVTATLQRILQAAAQADVAGARVTTVRPDSTGSGTPETGVNLYLYQVSPVNWRNADLPTRRSTGQFAKRPQIALNLSYLMTFYGNEVDMEPQRLLGAVVRTLHAQPTLSPDIIRETLDDPMFSYLTGSNLADEMETVKFMMLPLSTEDLSKIWSVFFQTPYMLSVAYQGGVVLLESDEIPQRALPVREPRFNIVPQRVSIDRVVCLDDAPRGGWTGSYPPIVPTSTLGIHGRGLADGPNTFVRIGEELEVPPHELSAGLLVVSLERVPHAQLRAGAQGIQVIHREAVNGSGALPKRITESNVAAFVLRPQIKDITAHDIEGEEDDPRTGHLTVHLDPVLGTRQRLVIFLNERSTVAPEAYSFVAPPRDRDTEQVDIPFNGVKAGEYLLRIQVDGAESLLDVDGDVNNPTYQQYIAPLVTIL